MANLQDQIGEKFLTALTESKNVDAEMIRGLRELFGSGKKLKVDDLVKIFSKPLSSVPK